MQPCHLSPSQDELLSRRHSELILITKLNNKGANNFIFDFKMMVFVAETTLKHNTRSHI